MEIHSLIEIVRRAQSGDSRAKQELYLDGSKSVYFNALKILRSKEDAEDITQDVFITVFEKLPELKNPAAYYKWVNQITANKCMSFLRKHKPIPTDDVILDILELEDDDAETPEKLLDDEATRRIIMEIIDALPDSQRVCVMYRYFNQLSIEEIAALTETNEHTVKSRLALARNKIRAAILEKEEKDGIRLHVLIPIMPVLMKALDEFTMPEDVTARMWDNIQKNLAGSNSPNAEKTGSPETVHNSGAASIGTNSAVKTVGKVILGMTAKKAVTAAIIVLLAGVLITAGVIFLPKMLNPADPTNTPGLSGTETPGTTTPDNTPGATGTTHTIPDIPEAPASDFEYEVTTDGILIIKYIGNSKTVRVPEKIDGKPVVGIDNWAFADCNSLTSVTIPTSVTYLGERVFMYCESLWAFADCNSLTSVTIPTSVTYLGERVFMYCESLKTVTMPYHSGELNWITEDGGQSIFERLLFEGCTALESVSVVVVDGVTKIDDNAFSDCSWITEITLPESVTEIGFNVFSGCSSLVDLKIPYMGGRLEDKNLFAGCDSLTNLTAIVSKSVTKIDDSAFMNIHQLTNIIIPETVTEIGEKAFWSCSRLKSITIPNSVKSIGQLVFADCLSLTSLTIPDSVTTIGSSAFLRCNSLESVTIGNGLTSIEAGLFIQLESLKTVTIGNSVTSIGGNAFSSCKSLKSVILGNSVTKISEHAFEFCGALESVNFPDAVTFIGDSAFRGCESLTSVALSNSLTSIGSYAFNGCASLTSITIPNNVKSIGHGAFTSCTSLTSVNIPDNVTHIGKYGTFDGTFELGPFDLIPNFSATYKGITYNSIVAPNSQWYMPSEFNDAFDNLIVQ